jgi:TPR repeat protein
VQSSILSPHSWINVRFVPAHDALEDLMTNLLRTLLIAAMLVLVLGVATASPLEDALAAFGRKDYAAALEDFRPLAAQGDADAQFFLGLIYFEGLGVAQQHKEAFKWFHLAADQGGAEAQWYVGIMHANARSVEKNETEAVKWYRLAAAQGFGNAQSFLGMAYANGKGVTRDLVYAYMWLDSAAAQNVTGAAEKRDQVAAELTPEEYEQAQMEAFACKDHGYKNCE